MGTVTTLEIQKRNKERVNVYLDGEYAFSLTVLEATKLRKGQVLSEAEISALRTQDEVQKAYDHASRFLGYRPRSTAEVRQNLHDKGYPPDAIDASIAKLTEQGYLDDHAFARYWVETRSTFNPRGARALRSELRQKGITDALINTVLANLDGDAEAYRAAEARAHRYKGKTQAEFKHKMGQFLARRGFDYRTSENVLAQLSEALLADDPHFFAGDSDDDF